LAAEWARTSLLSPVEAARVWLAIVERLIALGAFVTRLERALS
jgi:hypothetical protein